MLCEVCGTEIRMMSQRGTGVCSENCKSVKEAQTGTGARRRRHRGTGSTPSSQRGTTTF